MSKIEPKQLENLKQALSRMKIPREISENLLDASNVRKTYNAYFTNTRLLSRDQWVIDFMTLKACPIEDVTEDVRKQLLGSDSLKKWNKTQGDVSKRLDDTITQGKTILGHTQQRVKRVSLDIEAADLKILKTIADEKKVSIGFLIRNSIKDFIK